MLGTKTYTRSKKQTQELDGHASERLTSRQQANSRRAPQYQWSDQL